MPSEFAPLSRSPLLITVAGARVSIPHRPAAVWAEAIPRLNVLASLLAEPEDRALLADLVLTRPEAGRELRAESLRILAEATGRKWWEAGRLISTSVGPEVLGRLVLSGVDAWERSVGEWCAATYALCVKGNDEKGRIRFDFSLSIPPPGYEDEWDDGEDPAAVQAALGSMLGTR